MTTNKGFDMIITTTKEIIRKALAPFVTDANYVARPYSIIGVMDDWVIATYTSFESAVQALPDIQMKWPETELAITGWNHGTLLNTSDYRTLFVPAAGTFDCPICGLAQPHEHSGEDVAGHRASEFSLNSYNGKRHAEILSRAANVAKHYGSRPNLEAAVDALMAVLSYDN